MTINILTIKFANEIKPYETSLFRGAVINSLDNKLILFHDHDGNRLRYGYPLIQYKRIGKCAAIFCLDQGTEDIGELFSSNNFSMHLGDRQVDVQISNIMPSRYNIQIWDKMFKYRISRWIPFNSDNYKKYQELEVISDKISFLEKILTGNILSLAKGLGIWFEGKVECKITELSDSFMVSAKGIKMACFNAEFQSNVSLPSYVGLGKHVSIGFGTVTHKHMDRETNKKENNNNK